MKWLPICLTIVMCAYSVHAQVEGKGACPTKVVAVKNFNFTKFLGTWYNFQHYPVKFQDGYCPIYKITRLPNDNNLVINQADFNVTMFETKQQSPQKNATRKIESIGKLVQVAGTTDAKFTLNVKWSRDNKKQTILDYSDNFWVVSTNYESFALLWGCSQTTKNNITTNLQTSWIWSRDKKLKIGDKLTLDQVVSQNYISTSHFTAVEEYKCAATSLQAFSIVVLASLLSLIFKHL